MASMMSIHSYVAKCKALISTLSNAYRSDIYVQLECQAYEYVYRETFVNISQIPHNNCSS